MWNTFVEWYTSLDDEEHDINEDGVIRKAEECRRAITAKTEVQASVEKLQQEATELHSLF